MVHLLDVLRNSETVNGLNCTEIINLIIFFWYEDNATFITVGSKSISCCIFASIFPIVDKFVINFLMLLAICINHVMYLLDE